MHGRGDGMMLATLNGRDEVTKWADLLPGQRATRVQLTRFKGGSFPGSVLDGSHWQKSEGLWRPEGVGSG